MSARVSLNLYLHFFTVLQNFRIAADLDYSQCLFFIHLKVRYSSCVLRGNLVKKQITFLHNNNLLLQILISTVYERNEF